MISIIVASLLFIFAAAFGSTLIMKELSLTKEEAVEISRNSATVQEWMEGSDRYVLEVGYLNSTQVNRAREDSPEKYGYYPANNGIWIVNWYIHPKDALSAVAIVIGQEIDEQTGQILFEDLGALR